MEELVVAVHKKDQIHGSRHPTDCAHQRPLALTRAANIVLSKAEIGRQARGSLEIANRFVVFLLGRVGGDGGD